MPLSAALLSLNLRCILRLVAVFSVLMLGFALAGQYGMGWHPCELCLLQRYPYAAIIVLGAAGFLVRSERTMRYMVWFCVALLLLDAAIAFYHAGVEWGIFKGPDACSADSAGGKTLEQMRAEILGAPLVTCAQAMAYIFGLSLAAWNALLAFCAALATVFLLRKAA